MAAKFINKNNVNCEVPLGSKVHVVNLKSSHHIQSTMVHKP
jgi:hypothetical protein